MSNFTRYFIYTLCDGKQFIKLQNVFFIIILMSFLTRENAET